MKQIRVMHIVGEMNVGGTETMLMNLYRNIDKNRYHFTFVKFDSCQSYYDDEIVSLGGQIVSVSSPNSVTALYKLMMNTGPYDVIHVHTLLNSYAGIFAGRIAGVKKRICHAHTTLDEQVSLFRTLYSYLSRVLIIMFSTDYLSCSLEAGRYLFGDSKIKSCKYLMFRNTIDTTRLIFDYKKHSKKENELVIGHIGRFVESKNHKFLIDLLQYLHSHSVYAKLILVGDGELKQTIIDYSIEKKVYDYIEFIGITKGIEIQLLKMDVFVMPSLFEGLGMAVLEAQACGIPCVVSNTLPTEVDIDLGLVTFLDLQANMNEWMYAITAYHKSNIYINSSTRRIAFDKKGYSLKARTEELEYIYTK